VLVRAQSAPWPIEVLEHAGAIGDYLLRAGDISTEYPSTLRAT
jgi:hypothetical protein